MNFFWVFSFLLAISFVNGENTTKVSAAQLENTKSVNNTDIMIGNVIHRNITSNYRYGRYHTGCGCNCCRNRCGYGYRDNYQNYQYYRGCTRYCDCYYEPVCLDHESMVKVKDYDDMTLGQLTDMFLYTNQDYYVWDGHQYTKVIYLEHDSGIRDGIKIMKVETCKGTFKATEGHMITSSKTTKDLVVGDIVDGSRVGKISYTTTTRVITLGTVSHKISIDGISVYSFGGTPNVIFRTVWSSFWGSVHWFHLI